MSVASDYSSLEAQIGQWRAYLRRRRAINVCRRPTKHDGTLMMFTAIGAAPSGPITGLLLPPRVRSGYAL